LPNLAPNTLFCWENFNDLAYVRRHGGNRQADRD
jgi:hypothetical protein